jgi:hypothetical protein
MPLKPPRNLHPTAFQLTVRNHPPNISAWKGGCLKLTHAKGNTLFMVWLRWVTTRNYHALQLCLQHPGQSQIVIICYIPIQTLRHYFSVILPLNRDAASATETSEILLFRHGDSTKIPPSTILYRAVKQPANQFNTSTTLYRVVNQPMDQVKASIKLNTAVTQPTNQLKAE